MVNLSESEVILEPSDTSLDVLVDTPRDVPLDAPTDISAEQLKDRRLLGFLILIIIATIIISLVLLWNNYKQQNKLEVSNISNKTLSTPVQIADELKRSEVVISSKQKADIAVELRKATVNQSGKQKSDIFNEINKSLK